jgi:hypothetical protein
MSGHAVSLGIRPGGLGWKARRYRPQARQNLGYAEVFGILVVAAACGSGSR